ncbi:hypothetical protein ZIOFF_018728 [Zingiber officinale]|uniref:Dof zinc finger protein n=1 Tax=Zingiber officinale TaxID=94328 RepID=A0A8J5HGS7_ZINOF|nr:hypothetical protein ZIOFF_018728 [Zingiber officinale]
MPASGLRHTVGVTSGAVQGMGLQVKPMIMGDDQFASLAAKPRVVEREMREPQRPKARPSKEQQTLHCPRCKSTNTKFCYYNNYSLAQPRYFCKTCKRYWTEGGSLRNVPVGGGSRKNKNKTVTATGAAAAATTTSSSKAIWQESSSNNSYNLSAMDLLKSSTAVPVPLPDYAGTGFGGLMQEFMFPLEEQNKGQSGDPANGYWSGMLMGGGSW